MYSRVPKIGPKITIINADKNWNHIDQLRALESFMVQINAMIRSTEMIIDARNRMGLFNIVPKNHSEDVRGFHITSVIAQFHSSISIVACANCPVSINFTKNIKCLFNT